MALYDIGLKHRADKCYHKHYYPLYAHYLEHRIDSTSRVLELGIAQGGSLLTWLEYFPHALVLGVDNVVGNCDAVSNCDSRCHAILSDQANPALPNTILVRYGYFDLIVDDAGHLPAKQHESLKLFWPLLAPNGIYVVEDLETSYWHNADGDFRRRDGSMVDTLKAYVDTLNLPYIKQHGDLVLRLDGLVAIHFYQNIAFLFKGKL